LVVLKKNYYRVYVLSYRLNLEYFGSPKSGAPNMRGLPAVAGIAGGVLCHWWRVCQRNEYWLIFVSAPYNDVK